MPRFACLSVFEWLIMSLLHGKTVAHIAAGSLLPCCSPLPTTVIRAIRVTWKRKKYIRRAHLWLPGESANILMNEHLPQSVQDKAGWQNRRVQSGMYHLTEKINLRQD